MVWMAEYQSNRVLWGQVGPGSRKSIIRFLRLLSDPYRYGTTQCDVRHSVILQICQPIVSHTSVVSHLMRIIQIVEPKSWDRAPRQRHRMLAQFTWEKNQAIGLINLIDLESLSGGSNKPVLGKCS